MPADFDSTTLALLILDSAILVSLVGGVIASRRISLPKVVDPDVAFGLLESSVKRACPDLKDGFTWREALARVRGIDGSIDWLAVTMTLTQYEAYKYGKAVKPSGSFSDIVKLASRIRMVGGIGRRS